MHLIILYGPPASGKLTIAKELAKQTSFPLLHNHLVADFAHTFFEYGTDDYVHMATELRMQAIKHLIQAKKEGLIMTFAFGVETKEGKDDEHVLQTIQNLVFEAQGKVTFVHLTCSEKVLLKRVGNSSRQKFQKLTNPKILKTILDNCPVTKSISFTHSKEIDTTAVSPQEAVNQILT